MIIILIGLICVGLADVLQLAEENGAQDSTSAYIISNSSANIENDSKCAMNETAVSFELVGNIMVVAAQIFFSFATRSLARLMAATSLPTALKEIVCLPWALLACSAHHPQPAPLQKHTKDC